MLAIDRRNFIASLGGAATVGLMSHEARADALEEALLAQLNTNDAAAAGRCGGEPGRRRGERVPDCL